MLACHNYWHWALYLIEKVRWAALILSRRPVKSVSFYLLLYPRDNFLRLHI